MLSTQCLIVPLPDSVVFVISATVVISVFSLSAADCG